MKRGITIVLIVLLSGVFLGCATRSTSGPPLTIRIGSPFKEGHILVDTAAKFKEMVEQETGGRIKVVLQVGTESEEAINDKNSSGQIEMQSNGHRALEIYAPQYFFFNAPYVMKDLDHFTRVWNGKLGQKAREEVEKNGNVKYLGVVYRGLRQTTANKPLVTPDDVKGLKLRLPTVKTWIIVWKEIGADPIPIPLTELYASLKDGRAEASEGDLSQISSFKLQEVQSHLIMTNHQVQTGGMLIHKPFFEKLSRSDQKLILKASQKACDWGTERLIQSEEEILNTLKQKMKIVIPDAEAFRAKAKPAVEQLFKTEWPITTWSEVLAQ
jgi:tripartite ATP-independent transporter DctP family solute receptor